MKEWGIILTMKTLKENEVNYNKSFIWTNGFNQESRYESENERRWLKDRFDKDYLSEVDLDKIQAIS